MSILAPIAASETAGGSLKSVSRVPRLKRLVAPRRGKYNFIASARRGARVLDVGCGNNAPAYAKAIRPDIYYVGIDVMDLGHKEDPRSVADEYVVASPDSFASRVSEWVAEFDDVISTHNIEHCIEPKAVLEGMAAALQPGGRLLLAFPTEDSINFPSRAGCLNFHDDPTHLEPPRFDQILRLLRDEGMIITFAARRYRPILRAAVGLVLEPASRLRRRVMKGTWALWGFESVVWATKAVSGVKDTPDVRGALSPAAKRSRA